MSDVSAPGAPAARTEAFRSARDLLLDLREDHGAARARFRWPRPERFNYARDWFDAVAAGPSRRPRGPGRPRPRTPASSG